MLSAPRNIAMRMVPRDEMTVDRTSPQSRWKPPFADTLAISDAFAMVFLLCCFICWWCGGVYRLWFGCVVWWV